MNGYNNNIEYMKLFLVDRLKEAITECSHWSFEYAINPAINNRPSINYAA